MATYKVKELISAYSIPTLCGDFPRRSAAEAWLIDYVTEFRGSIIGRDNDDENDAIDFMVAHGSALRQFAVEPEDS
jgi:hypothetical protein